jgi:hypothetical protein
MAGVALAASMGCKISKEGHGEDKKVSIDVPGASIKVDKGLAANDSGIPLYPAAEQKPGSENESHRAHVSLNTPFVSLKVVKLEYLSKDSPEKVLAYYRDKLSTYGAVVECKGGADDIEIGYNSKDGKKRNLQSPVDCTHSSGKKDGTTLKVGTQGNAHVVEVRPNGQGTEFSLVYVYVGNGKDEEDYSGKQPS